MNYKKPVLFLCLLLSVCLTACRSDKSKNMSVGVTDVPGVTDAVTPTESAFPTGEDPSPHVVWAVHFTVDIPEEAQVVVQRFLKEKGIDCRVDFLPTSYLVGDEYTDWLAQQKEEGTVPDILSACVWESGVIEASAFVEKEFIPLKEYLDTEEGRKLRGSFSEVEWERTVVNGEIYTVPERTFPEPDRVCLYVNNRYWNVFEEMYDGTYASLRAVCEALPDPHPVITSMRPGKSLLTSLEGYRNVFQLSYFLKDRTMVDLTRHNGTKELLQMVFEDHQNGLWVDVETPEEVPSNTLVYIGGKTDLPDGYTEVVLSPDLFLTAPGISYGVLSSSPRKELALQVLSTCYSDPEIASLLFWKESDGKEWEKWTAYLNTFEASPLTGFVPDLTPEQRHAQQRYMEDTSALCSKLYVNRGGVIELNPDYPQYLDWAYENPTDYGDVFEEMNRQLAAWLDGRE